MTNATTMTQEEKILLSSILGSDLYSQMPQGGEGKVRRRRKKAKEEGGAGGEGKKRRLTDEQVRFLETNFGKERKLESGRKVNLATEIGIDPKQVAVWFQNRRARWKNKQMEEEYLRLKAMHDAIVIEKCHLENEVLKLKERLSEAEEEIRKVTGGVNGGGSAGSGSGSGNSPSPSSFSTVTYQPLLEEIAAAATATAAAGAEYADLMYISEYNNYMQEWVNMYGM